MISRPTAQLFLKRVMKDAEDPDEDAHVFTWPDSYFECDVQYASADGNGVSILQADLYNIDFGFIRQLEPNGVVKLVAGYDGIYDYTSDKLPPVPRPIFYGSLDYAYPVRQGAERILRIQASSSPTRLANTYVAINASSDNPITVADALRQLFEQAGGQILPPPQSAEDTKLPAYATLPGRSVLDEAAYLVQYLSAKTGQEHILVPNPFAQSAPFTYAVVNLADPSVNEVTLDFEAHDLYNASRILVKGQPDATMPVGDLVQFGPDAADAAMSGTLDYAVTMAFDPRLALGMRANLVNSEDAGQFLITTLSHALGGQRWETSFRGPFRQADPA